MAGLLNLVPQYLPRYGMAPEWTLAFRPLVVLFTGINLFVTWVFDASVKAQSNAYATGVLVLITSACVATVIDRSRCSSSPKPTSGCMISTSGAFPVRSSTAAAARTIARTCIS